MSQNELDYVVQLQRVFTQEQYEPLAHSADTIIRFVLWGTPMGGFLTAVFENDLSEAVGRADSTNRKLLVEYATLLYNHIPSWCHGNPKRVAEWDGVFSDECAICKRRTRTGRMTCGDDACYEELHKLQRTDERAT